MGGRNWSKDSRGRYFDATGVAISGGDGDGSCDAFLRPQDVLSPCLCCKVDLRREEDLRGKAVKPDAKDAPAAMEAAES